MSEREGPPDPETGCAIIGLGVIALAGLEHLIFLLLFGPAAVALLVLLEMMAIGLIGLWLGRRTP